MPAHYLKDSLAITNVTNLVKQIPMAEFIFDGPVFSLITGKNNHLVVIYQSLDK
jgi:hypothetical protein